MRFPLMGYVVCVPIAAMIGLFFIGSYINAMGGNYYSVARQNPRAVVCQVAADPVVAGKVYADVQRGSCIDRPGTTYESADYGQHWHTIPFPFAGMSNHTEQLLGISQTGDELWFGGARVWTLPKRTFRAFFSNPGANTLTIHSM